ncbi:MAG: RelA/SpoT domain-containing protein [Proteobacteria bacterium]|nr:RelA/SpoT domain-containing protein [Pseudomonadota bacterium]
MEIDTKAITQQFDENTPKYTELKNKVDYILKKSIKNKNIKIHGVNSRIKGISSFIDKIRRKNITRPFEQVHDLVGCRVICLFLSDLDKIRKILIEEFDVFEEDDKVNDSEMEFFGYMSLHLKARLKNSYDTLSTNDVGNNISFEIQVRTITQDAWAAISNHLDYKQSTSFIPKELKRDFYALNGLFYVADTHFSILQKEGLK